MTAPPREPLALDTTVFARGLRTRRGSPLYDIDLDVLPGEIYVIVGRAGAGKTTLLESLVGLHEVHADELIVCGSDPRAFPAAVRQRIGVAARRATVERTWRVDEALHLFRTFYQRSVDLDALLDVLHLTSYRHWLAGRLPPGPAQCFSLALALVNDPVALFVDEPTHDLDPELTRHIWDLLRDQRRRGRTVVMTTDHLEEAERLADRVAVLHRGRLVAVAPPAHLLSRTARKVVVTFDLARPSLDPLVLSGLDAAVSADRTGDVYSVWSTDGFATIRALTRVLDASGATPRTLQLRYPTLEDVFFELTTEAA